LTIRRGSRHDRAAVEQPRVFGGQLAWGDLVLSRARSEHAHALAARELHPRSDVRRQRSHSARELGRPVRRVQPAILSVDLVRDRHTLGRLLLERGAPIESLDEKVASESREPGRESAVRVIGRDRLVPLQADGSRVHLCSRAHDRDAGAVVTRLDRALDRRRTAPARQQ
jgi:hypothetical protein